MIISPLTKASSAKTSTLASLITNDEIAINGAVTTKANVNNFLPFS